MYDKRIFGIQEFSFSRPWEIIIVTADRETVVADTDDLSLRLYDTGADLCRRILGTQGAQVRQSHKIVIPA